MNAFILIKNQLRHNAFVLTAIFVFLAALPFTVFELQKLNQFRARGADFSLVPYPGLEWSQPKDYTISVITNPQTPDESLFISKGMAVAAETNTNISPAVFSFYDKLLISKEFVRTKLTGDPDNSQHWVATYNHEGNLCQVQFYPTPYKEGTYTILLYFGNAAN